MALRVTYMTLPMQAQGRRQNVGDRVIHLGVRNIMRCAIGPHEETVVSLATDKPVPPDTDVLVVCGTPQIADMHQVVGVVRRTALAASAAVPVRLNIGAGAFYFDAFGLDRAGADAAFAERVRSSPAAAAYAEYRGFDLIIARDLAATAALRALGVAAVPLPCPGFFAPLFQPRPLLRHDRLLVSVLNGGASFWNRVSGDVHGFYARLHGLHPDAVFIAHDEEDCEMLTDLGIPQVAFEDADSLVAMLAAHRRILSLRVHGALPAWSLGLDVTLLGLDRRALLGEDFGASFRVLPLREEADLQRAIAAPEAARPLQDEATRSAWIERHLALYVRNIRAAIAAVLGPQPPVEEAARPPVPRPAMLAEPGSYRTRLYYSTARDFPVHADQLRSQYPAESDLAGIDLITDGEARTLVFGPYVLVPRGRWRARLRIAADPPPGMPSAPPELMLSVNKGNPVQLLGTMAIQPQPVAVEADPFVIDFENPRDTGLLETVLRPAGDPLAPGWRVRVSDLRFEQLD